MKAGRPKTRDLELTIQKAKELFLAGHTQLEVSQKLGFSSLPTMRSYLTRNNSSIKLLKGGEE